MNAYFDTSALIPLVIDEEGSRVATRFWDTATRLISTRLIYPEARAAVAQAHRLGRVTDATLRKAHADIDTLIAQLDIVELDISLARRAGDLAEAHALRGYDAVHLASAERANDDELVLVAGDAHLLAAAGELGLHRASTA